MLRSMRTASKSWVMKGVLAFLALTFVAFFGGVSGIGGGGGHPNSRSNGNPIVQVGGMDIDASTISTAFNREVQAVSQAIGSPINVEQAIQLGVLNRAISGIVTDTVYALGAFDLGIIISDDQVAGFIRAQPQFQGENGFDGGAYASFLVQTGISEAQFINQLREELERTHLLSAVEAASAAPFSIVDRIYNYRNETRVFEGAIIGSIDVDEVFEPNADELAEFYRETGNNYQTPEYRRVTMVSLSPEQYADQLTITDEDLAREYADRRSAFVIPEQRELVQIVVGTSDAAQAAADAISSGADFASVAQDATGGDPVSLGQVTSNDIIPELADAFAVAAGEITAPIETPLGWHLIRAEAVYEGETPSIDDVRDELTEIASLIRARDEIFEVMDAVEDSLAAGAPLAEAGNESGLTVRELVVAADGTGIDGEFVDDFARSRTILANIFTTAPGAEAELHEDPNGGFFSFVVEGVIPAEPLPLEEIRDDLVFDWQDRKVRDLAQQKADAVIGAVAGGVPFAEAADDADLAVTVSSQPAAGVRMP